MSTGPFDLERPANALDVSGFPSSVCVCGSRTFLAVVQFDDDYELSGYYLDGECLECGAKVTLPTPLDKE